VAGEEQDVSARTVHLVRFTGMNRLLLHCFDAKSLEFLVEDLAQIHDDRLVNLLPQMGSEDLDKRYLEGWNFAVQENTREIELDLETDVDVGSIDGWRPPQSEATVGNLVQTGTLGVGEFLELHGLFETCTDISDLQQREQPQKNIPDAFSQNNPSHDGKAVALKSVCSRIVSTPPRAWITSVLYEFKFPYRVSDMSTARGYGRERTYIVYRRVAGWSTRRDCSSCAGRS
jgi:hypothetical protein